MRTVLDRVARCAGAALHPYRSQPPRPAYTQMGILALGLAASVAVAVIPATAAAQQVDDDEWLEDCRDQRDRRLERHCAVQVYRVETAGTPIRLDAHPNGGVQVLGWDGGHIEVHLRVTARAETEADARALAEQVRFAASGTSLSVDGPDHTREANWYASFVLLVPASSDLDVETTNGPLSVRGVSGRMDLSTHNGPLSLRDVSGDVRARAQNGPLTVALSGVAWDGPGLDAETTNGPMTLYIPDGYSANLETGTTNGPMNTDVPLTVTRLGRRTHINTVLGAGGAPIRAVTTNGPLSIRRR